MLSYFYFIISMAVTISIFYILLRKYFQKGQKKTNRDETDFQKVGSGPENINIRPIDYSGDALLSGKQTIKKEMEDLENKIKNIPSKHDEDQEDPHNET